METEFLTTKELAARWKMSYKIVSEWRCSGYGPEFHKMGNRVRYRIEDVEKFEESKKHQNTSTFTPPSHKAYSQLFFKNHTKQNMKTNS